MQAVPQEPSNVSCHKHPWRNPSQGDTCVAQSIREHRMSPAPARPQEVLAYPRPSLWESNFDVSIGGKTDAGTEKDRDIFFSVPAKPSAPSVENTRDVDTQWYMVGIIG